jgi:Rrf2 family protein
MKTFLNIPQKVELAITLVTELAAHGTAEPRSLEDIARKDGLSQGYLEEVARLLRSAGLIVGRRGAKGGYVLAKRPEEITVADVITAVEGRCWSENCLGQERDVVAERHEIWRKVQGQVMATLYGMTIKDLH